MFIFFYTDFYLLINILAVKSQVWLDSNWMFLKHLSLCPQEYQPCNTLPCPDLKKTTPWTPWTPVNISDNGGHYEQRFRYTCKARIPDPSLLEVGRQRIEMRYCSSDGSTGCSTDGEWVEEFSLQLSQPLDVSLISLQLAFVSLCRLVTGLLASSYSFSLCVCCSLDFFPLSIPPTFLSAVLKKVSQVLS